MPALEPWTGTRRLLMLVEKPLPGSPPRPVPAAIGRDIFGAAPSASKRKRPWFVYRGMIDRQSGQGEETSQRREPRCIVYRASCIAHRTLRNDEAWCGLLQQDNCLSGSMVRLKRPVMFQSRVERPSTLAGAASMDRTAARMGFIVTFAPSRQYCHLRLARWGLRPRVVLCQCQSAARTGEKPPDWICRKRGSPSHVQSLLCCRRALAALQIWAQGDADGELHSQGHRGRGFPWRLIDCPLRGPLTSAGINPIDSLGDIKPRQCSCRATLLQQRTQQTYHSLTDRVWVIACLVILFPG